MKMANLKHCFLFFLSFILLLLTCEPSEYWKEKIRVGVILDFNSPVGRIADRCISMALLDFYAANANYRTRLHLLRMDSQNDVVVAASAAIDLMKNEKVHAIIGPQRTAEARFVIDLGGKAKVPIISFSATSPSLSPMESEFFVRTAHDDSFQVKAIADIVKNYGWMEVIFIYQDTDYGNGLIPYLTDALQEINTRVRYRSVISPNWNDDQIFKELQKLKTNYPRTTIFLVHMTASHGSKLFLQANKAGMMNEGYAWIVTEGLSSILDPLDSKAIDSMQGVLGLRPFIPPSPKLELFRSKWMKSYKPYSSSKGLNLFGLWAYDTVWAIAMAIEQAEAANSSFIKPKTSKNKVDIAALGTFEMGQKLLNTLLNTTFNGLSGKFQLLNGQLEPPAFEIFNVIGEYERIIGYWTQGKGLQRDLNANGKAVNSSSSTKKKLKDPIWPGDTKDQPKKLRIGVPVRSGFTEFIKVQEQPDKSLKITGFSYEVFKEVLDVLDFPLPHEFVQFGENGKSAGSYTDLLHKIQNQEYDAVVGDTTIVANRSNFVDFTLPYSESGVSMVVLMKKDEKRNIWIFLKPLSLDLWLTTGAVFIFTGLVVWVLEHRINTEFRGPPEHQLGTIFWFSFSTLVFAHRERLVNNLSRFVLIIWVFVVLILTQSYAASLASMLTVKRLQPSFDDVLKIQKLGYLVGYQKDSFVKDLLTKELNFNESKLRNYSTPEEYHEALSKGEVAAIFDEIPYIKLFLDKYCSKYMITGPIYRTDGFGFAFAQGSPLVSNISRAILNVTQDKEKMERIERNAFGKKPTCEGQGADPPSEGLDVYSFGGLFIITGVTSMFALLVYVFNFVRSQWSVLNDHIHPESSFHSKIVELIKLFDKKDHSSHHFNGNESRVHPQPSPGAIGTSHDHISDRQNNSRTSSEGEENNVSDRKDDELHSSMHNDT